MGLVRSEFEGLDTINMTADDRFGAITLASRFHDALESGLDEETARSIKLGITKAALIISDEEKAAGLNHKLADGDPFFRITLDARGKVAEMNDAVKTVLHVMEAYNGRAVANLVCDDHVKLTLDLRGDLTKEAEKLQEATVSAVHFIKAQKINGPKI